MTNLRVDVETPHHWRKISKEAPVRCPALAGEDDAEFAVIGGGYTGLVAALTLAEQGRLVVLLERNEIGSGASGRNNGLVLSHHSKASPGEIVDMLGRARGERCNALVQGAAAVAFGLMRKHSIQCDPVEGDWVQTVHDEGRALGATVE